MNEFMENYEEEKRAIDAEIESGLRNLAAKLSDLNEWTEKHQRSQETPQQEQQQQDKQLETPQQEQQQQDKQLETPQQEQEQQQGSSCSIM